jgi:hypothetical protein
MSSTGFVTFKTITPVTVSTSAPLTYSGIPIEVFVAPETRDIVWKNIQVCVLYNCVSGATLKYLNATVDF